MELTDSDKEFIRTYVAEAQDDEHQKVRRKECAEQFGVSLPTISAVTAWTKIRENKTKLVSKPIEIAAVPNEDSADGCHANYDNPTKQAWREQWKNFIASHTLPGERENMKVLCLPGKKCLEIPLYLELGFKPKNITGVEGGDDAAKNEFHHNAYRYGIASRLGRLENIVVNESSVYDVISLDFTGPVSKTCLDIVKMLPIAPNGNSQLNKKSYFMINLMAKRESQNNQSCIDYYASFTRPELTKMLDGPGISINKFAGVFGYINELSTKAANGEKIYEEASLKEKRNAGLTFLLSSLIGKDRRFSDSVWASYRLAEISYETRRGMDFGTYTATAMSELLIGLSFYINKKILDVLAIGTPQLIETVSNYRPFVYDVEQYQYTSPVNNASSPFITEMFEFMTPMADYIKLRYFVRFFVDAIFWQGMNEGKAIHLEVRDKHGHHKHPCGSLHNKDNIAFVSEDGFVISSITWQRVIEAWMTFMVHIDNDKTVKIIDESRNFDLSETAKVTI